MHYHKEKNHLVIEIDERIQGMTLLEFFHYLHLSKKTIHLLRQNKDYTLNNTYVDYQTILKSMKMTCFVSSINQATSLFILMIKVKKILFVIM